MRAPSHRYTWDDYLRVEETSSTRHEFFAGEIYAMAGGTAEHAELCVNLTASLRNQLQGRPCRIFSSDLMVRVRASGLGTYPDASVVCGELELDPDSKRRTLLNPTMLFEVLSDSTEEYDRGAKFEHFQQILSLQEYVLVSSRERLVEVFRRTDGPWLRTQARAGESAALESIGCRLAVDELYANLAI